MWIHDMFGVQKPIVALLHLDALPGDPGFCGSVDAVLNHAGEDLRALQDGGVDGILFANEFSLPYQPVADIATISTMAYIIGSLKSELKIPYGVNVVKNPIATIELGAATGAKFGRSCFSGAYMGEYGLYASNSGEAVRRRKALEIQDFKLLFKVNPEADTYLVHRDVKVVAKSIMFGGFADGLCVSGFMAGGDAPYEQLIDVKKAVGDFPVVANTGVKFDNVRRILEIADACCVATCLKVDGNANNPIDVNNVRKMMACATEGKD